MCCSFSRQVRVQVLPHSRGLVLLSCAMYPPRRSAAANAVGLHSRSLSKKGALAARTASSSCNDKADNIKYVPRWCLRGKVVKPLHDLKCLFTAYDMGSPA